MDSGGFCEWRKKDMKYLLKLGKVEKLWGKKTEKMTVKSEIFCECKKLELQVYLEDSGS